ncbi:hypothetical protein WOLCODRAFT_28764, partial [Wolfiporia cocos MD-104 SS10]
MAAAPVWFIAARPAGLCDGPFRRRGAVADRACSRVAFASADENVTSTPAYMGAFGGRYQSRKRTAEIINASRPCHLAPVDEPYP